MPSFKPFRVLIFLMLTAVGLAFAQRQRPLTIQWMNSPECRRINSTPRFFWLKDGTAILFDERQPDSLRAFERFDPETGRRKPLLNSEKVLEQFRKLLGADAPKSLGWPAAISPDGKWFLYEIKGDLFAVETGKNSVRRITETKATEKDARFAPDGKKLAFVRDNDLYMYNFFDSQEKRLTFDGSHTVLNGTLSWVYWEEIFGRHDIGYWWSSDSKALAYLQTNESGVNEMWFVDFHPFSPRLITQRYPRAGQKNPRVRVGMVEINEPRTVWADIDTSRYEYIVRVNWLPDQRRICVRTLNRPQTQMDFYLADRSIGAAERFFRETDSCWVNIDDDLYFLKNDRGFILASERSGYKHLYLFDMHGQLINRITRGDWALHSSGGGVAWVDRAICGVDEKNQWIYFTALKKSPIERHLYRVHFDGSGLERLSREDGAHRITFSPDLKYYFDVFSDIRTPSSLTLYRNDGSRQQTLAASQVLALKDFGLQYPQFFTIRARDGFELPASLLKPADFDSTKHYPVILYVYGGPSAPTVVDSWNSFIYWENLLLQNGYLVMRVDNRVSTGISKKLENLALHRLMGKIQIDDLTDAVRWLKSRSFVDSGRVGIWGWSGGGTYTLAAMTRTREFKAGIAVAAVTDFRYYDTRWAEFTLKTPREDPEGYRASSVLKDADQLHGRLMLVHGTYDDNVHPPNAWAFIDRLIKANKRFELMMYPMRKHGISDPPARIHLFSTMLDFWKRNL